MTDGEQRENIPDIDYTDLWEVRQKAGFDYDQQLAIESKCESLEVGDEVVINNRKRALTVVPHEETEGLLENAFGETLFLKGNGTEYRLTFGSGVPELDRSHMTTAENVAFLRIDSEADNDEKELVADGGYTLLTTSGIRERMNASGQIATKLKDEFVTVEQLLDAVESDEPLTDIDDIGPKTAETVSDWYENREEREKQASGATFTQTSAKSMTIKNNGDWSDALGVNATGEA